MGQRTFTVGLPEELLALVEVLASDEGVSRNAFVRRALEVAVKRPEPVAPRKGDHVPPEFVKDPRLAIEPSPPDTSGANTILPRKPSANYGSHERYGPRKPRGKPFQKS